MPKEPRGDQPIKVTVSTKVTEAEHEQMVAEHGSAYAALRAAIDCTKTDDIRRMRSVEDPNFTLPWTEEGAS